MSSASHRNGWYRLAVVQSVINIVFLGILLLGGGDADGVQPGVAAASGGETIQEFDTIKAHRVILVDENGDSVGGLSALERGGGLVLSGGGKAGSVWMGATPEGVFLGMWLPGHEQVVSLTTGPDWGTRFVVRSPSKAAELGVSLSGGSAQVWRFSEGAETRWDFQPGGWGIRTSVQSRSDEADNAGKCSKGLSEGEKGRWPNSQGREKIGKDAGGAEE